MTTVVRGTYYGTASSGASLNEPPPQILADRTHARMRE